MRVFVCLYARFFLLLFFFFFSRHRRIACVMCIHSPREKYQSPHRIERGKGKKKALDVQQQATATIRIMILFFVGFFVQFTNVITFQTSEGFFFHFHCKCSLLRKIYTSSFRFVHLNCFPHTRA